MPFGFKNAPSVFQRAILKVLGDLAYAYVVVYLDDFLIITDSIDQALDPAGSARFCEPIGAGKPTFPQPGGPSGQASRLRQFSMYSAGKVVGSVRGLRMITLSLRGLG